MNANPYFNEVGYSDFSGTPHWEVFSQNYNEETFIKSVQTMVFILRKQPLVRISESHFYTLDNAYIGKWCMIFLQVMCFMRVQI